MYICTCGEQGHLCANSCVSGFVSVYVDVALCVSTGQIQIDR